MIRFIYNGKFRTKKVTIKLFLNDIELFENGFPYEESLTQEFPGFNQINEEQFLALTDFQFNARVEAFKSFLVLKHSFLSMSDFVGSPTGIDNNVCLPGTIVSQSNISITANTEVIIFFDSSGSMNSTLSPLTIMRNTLLKTALLPFYGNNESLYDQKVRVISDPSERTFFQLANRSNSLSGEQLIMVFQDEAQPIYHPINSFEPRTLSFENDIALLRSRIEALPSSTYRGIVFQVSRGDDGYGLPFKSLIQSVEGGTGLYSGVNGLSDKSEFAYEYDVINGSTPNYYMDLIILKMQQLGYRI